MPQTEMGFVEKLRQGYGHQRDIARRFLDAGYAVYLPPLSIRPTFEDRAEYSDKLDMKIAWGEPPHKRWLVVECKSRDLAFTGPGDFPYQTIIVDEVGGWHRKEGLGAPPDLYAFISQATGDAMLLDTASTRADWTVEKKWSKAYYVTDVASCQAFDEWVLRQDPHGDSQSAAPERDDGEEH